MCRTVVVQNRASMVLQFLWVGSFIMGDGGHSSGVEAVSQSVGGGFNCPEPSV